MNNRVRLVRQDAGLSMRAFGDRLGISSAAVSKIETGVNVPSEQTIRGICSEFKINRDWLEFGTGQMKYDQEAHMDVLHSLRKFPHTLNALASMTDQELACLEGFLERYFGQKQK